MVQIQRAEKSKSNKMVRVLVYEGDEEWIRDTLSKGMHRTLVIGDNKITETFRGTWQEFIKKMMGEEVR
jgi:hypothetical protein